MFPYHYGSHATDFNAEEYVVLLKFPYHYGSHATHRTQFYTLLLYCFHTTMVLTQLLQQGRRRIHFNVSIPLWFSRNLGFMRYSRVLETFPYHYGSHATQSRATFLLFFYIVSIPLWFSRNDLCKLL